MPAPPVLRRRLTRRSVADAILCTLHTVPCTLLFRVLLFCCLLPVACCLLSCDRGSHPAQVGEQAPNVVIRNGAQTVRLSDYRGKTVVLNFWASWCPPCVEEFPYLIDLQRRMPNIVVLAVSFDTDPNAYRQYLIDNHIAGITTILDLSQQSNHAFDTTRPPETYIIDPHGIIRRKFIGAQDFTSPEIMNYIRNL